METTNPDPKRPWKMYAGVVAAIGSYLLTQEALELPVWAVLVLNALSIGIAVYFTPNPEA